MAATTPANTSPRRGAVGKARAAATSAAKLGRDVAAVRTAASSIPPGSKARRRSGRRAAGGRTGAAGSQARSGELVPAPKKPGSRKHKPLVAAPGTYVHEE